jgi:hypothetical protein
MLNHDSSGFLLGDLVDLKEQLRLLNDIRQDIGLIRSMLAGQRSSRVALVNQRANTNDSVSTVPARRSGDVSRVYTDAFANHQAAYLPKWPRLHSVAASSGINASKRWTYGNRGAAVDLGWDSQGQFIGANSGAGKFEVAEEASDSLLAGSLGRLGDSLDVIARNSQGVENIDLEIKAMGEITRPVSVGFSAVSSLFRSEGRANKEHSRWYRRVWGELSLFRKSETAFGKAQSKTLKAIENKPVGGSSGMSWLLPLLMGLSRMIPGLPSIVGGARFGGDRRRRPGPPRPGPPRPGPRPNRWLKKIPWLGALLAGGMTALDINQTEGDESLGRREKDIANSQVAGGLAGTLGGVAAGAAVGSVLGPVGAIVGSVVGGFLGDQGGQIIGEVVGGWVNDLRSADVPGQIQSAWTSTTEYLRKKWASITGLWESVASGWLDFVGSLSDSFGWLDDFLRTVTGIDLAAAGQSVKEGAGNLLGYLSQETTIGQVIAGVMQLFSGLMAGESPTSASTSVGGSVNVATGREQGTAKSTLIMSHSPAVITQPPISVRSASTRTPAAAEAPAVKSTLATNRDPSIKVVVAPSESGQDVRDRQIAHVVTGGMSGG